MLVTTIGWAESAADSGIAGTLPEDQLPALKAIMETALKQSPTMMAQNIALAQSLANRYYSSAALWPTLSASGNYGFNGGETTSEPKSSSRGTGLGYGIGFNQALYQWGANKAQSDIGKLSQRIAERQFAEAFRGLAVTLRSQYLSLIAKKIALQGARYQLQLQDAALAAAEDQLKEGTLAEGDLIALRLGTQDSRLALDRMGQDYDYARRVFQRLAGLDDLAEASIPTDVARPPYSAETATALLSAFLGGGVEDTPQAQSYALTLSQNDLNLKIVKTNLYYPKFSIGAGYNLSTSTYFTPQPVTSSGIQYNVTLSANVPLFNGFAQKGAKLSAYTAKRSTEQQRRSYLNATADTATNMRQQLDLSARALDLAEVRRALAQDAVQRTTEQFNDGTVSKVIVEGTVANLNTVNLYAVQARSDYLNRWSEFVSLVGADPILHVLPASYLTLNHGK
jgi:outer membrane protein